MEEQYTQGQNLQDGVAGNVDPSSLTDEQLERRIAAESPVEEDRSVSLNQVLGAEEVQNKPQESTQPGPASEANGQTTPGKRIEDDPRWQAAFDYHVGKRMEAVRKKVLAEHEEDLRIARAVRLMFPNRQAGGQGGQPTQQAGTGPDSKVVDLFRNALINRIRAGAMARAGSGQSTNPLAQSAQPTQNEKIATELVAMQREGLFIPGDLERLAQEKPKLMADLVGGRSPREVLTEELVNLRVKEGIGSIRARNQGPRPLSGGTGGRRKVAIDQLTASDFKKIDEAVARGERVRFDE